MELGWFLADLYSVCSYFSARNAPFRLSFRSFFFVEREQRLLAFSASHVKQTGHSQSDLFFFFSCAHHAFFVLSFTSKVATAANNNKRSAAAMVRFEFAFISARETSRALVLF